MLTYTSSTASYASSRHTRFRPNKLVSCPRCLSLCLSFAFSLTHSLSLSLSLSLFRSPALSLSCSLALSLSRSLALALALALSLSISHLLTHSHALSLCLSSRARSLCLSSLSVSPPSLFHSHSRCLSLARTLSHRQFLYKCRGFMAVYVDDVLPAWYAEHSLAAPACTRTGLAQSICAPACMPTVAASSSCDSIGGQWRCVGMERLDR